MSEALDFSELTDDQIVELASGLAREAMLRHPAVQAAFEQALVTERDRAHALARGAQQAKVQELQALRAQSQRAEAERVHEALAARERAALGRYLHQAAEILGRPVGELTLVWGPGHYDKPAPFVHVNAGQTGVDAPWHIVTFLERGRSLHCAPAARAKSPELLPWAVELCAAARALGLSKTTVVHGVNL
jgi:hypothetical protein